MSEPLVTVIVLAYNDLPHVHRAIKSVLRQTYQNLKIKILDNGSTDNTWEEIQKYASDPRVTLIRNNQNQRSEFCAYEALKTDTEYLSFLFADDVYMPERIAVGMKAFCNQPDLNAIFFNVNGVNEHGKPVCGNHYTFFDKDISLMSCHEHLRYFLFHGNSLHPCGMLIKTAIYVELGGFKPYYHRIGDMIFFTRLLARNQVRFLKDKMQNITLWSNGRNESVRNAISESVAMACERTMFFEEFLSPVVMEQYVDIFEGKNSMGVTLKTPAERLWYFGHKLLMLNSSYDARLCAFRCLFRAAEIADAEFHQNVAMATGQTVAQYLAALSSHATQRDPIQRWSVGSLIRRAIKKIPFSVRLYRYLKRICPRDPTTRRARLILLPGAVISDIPRLTRRITRKALRPWRWIRGEIRYQLGKNKGVRRPGELVYTCNNIERGVRFAIEGVRCCCASTRQSPVIITAEEMKNKKITHDLIVQRKTQLFNAINAGDPSAGDCLKCSLLHKKPYADVSFDYLGGPEMCSGFNIAHFSTCNLRCSYCDYTIKNLFEPPQYNNVIEYIEVYRKRGKIIPGGGIDYNGGEPTLLPKYEEILNYLIKYDIGCISFYTNCVKYSDAVYNALKDNKIQIITSLDAGTAETYKKIKGANIFDRVVGNIKKYQSSGTKMLLLKYVICHENMNDDDLHGFVRLVEEIKPGDVGLMPDFPYGDRQIPDEMVQFGAKLLFELNKFRPNPVHIFSDYAPSDPKFVKYSKDIRDVYRELYEPQLLKLKRQRCLAA